MLPALSAAIQPGTATSLPRLREAARALAKCDDSVYSPWIGHLIVAELCATGDLDAAVREARALLRALPRSAFDLQTRNLLASALRALGRWDESTRALDEMAVRLREERELDHDDRTRLELDRVESGLYSARAQIAQELGTPDLALQLISRAEELARRTAVADTVAEALLRRADLWLLTDRFAEVERSMTDSLGDSAAGFTALQRAQFTLYRGAARTELDDEKAVDDLRAALASALSARDRRRAHTYLIDSLLRLGDLESAGQVAAELRDSYAGQAIDARAAAQLARVAIATGADAAELRPHMARLEAAYDSFLDAVSRVPPRPGGVGFLHSSHRRQVVSELIRVARIVDPSQRGTERALEYLLRAQALGSLARKLEGGAAGVAEVRAAALAEGHGALIYLVSRDVTHLFALDREQVIHREIGRRMTGMRRDLSPLRGALIRQPDPERAQPASTALRAAATRAAELLLPPAVRARLATWSAVTVVGSEMLLEIPFECLAVGDSMLGLRHAVVTTPSLPLMVAMARQPRARVEPDRLAVHLFATLESPARADGMLFGEAHGRRLTRAFSESATAMTTGADFTRSALLDADFSGVQVLHLLAHGSYDHTRERGSCLLATPALDDDGMVHCEDIDELGFRGLVVLTACDTARGPTRVGEDVAAHLGGAFLWGGAQAVVVSSSALHYETSMELAEAFYDRLARGASPAEALRAARLRLAEDRDPWWLFHLAPLQVMGLGHLPLSK